MYCERCGKRRDAEDKFCTECGNQYQQSNIHNQPKKDTNIVLILGIISCVLIVIPFLSIPIAIISVIIGVKTKKQPTNLIPAIISLVLSLLQLIIIILTFITFYNQIKTNISNELLEENYYYEPIPSQESYDISGHQWIGDDNSVLHLNKNNRYIWYQSQENQTDNFYEGTYEIYTGHDAISYIANNLQEYGLTEYDQTNNINESNHTISEYYLIKLVCEKIVINGIEKTPNNNIIYYYGYYEEERNYLDLINMNTQNQAGFTEKDTINTIEIHKNTPILSLF